MVRLTLEDFIKKAILKHNNKYIYDNVKYVNNRTKVTIICPIHGEFEQTPNKHLLGRGCPKCGIEKNADKQRNTREEFIERAKKVHGDKYDYSKVIYVNANTKVCIICPIHGEFWQKPYHHLNGHGCSKCAKSKNVEKRKKLTKEEFIKRAKELYHDFYDYTNTNYVFCNRKVIVTCPNHGDFMVTPQAHLKGKSCPICAKNKKETLCTEKYIQLANKIHGDKYDYSKVVYVNNHTKIKIICPIHGEFEMLPQAHINSKTGCPMCSFKKPTTEEFIKRAKKIHGNKYIYTKVQYENMVKNVCIICPIHGEFWQKPYLHLARHGCPKCKESRLERELSVYLDEHKITYINQYKAKWLGRKSLDFYLPDYNVVIECQGKQHFKKGGYIFNEEKVKKTKESDLLKKQLCEEQGIKILYYTNVKVPKDFDLYHVYTDIDELFNEIAKS